MLHHNRRLSEDSLVAGELGKVESHRGSGLDVAGYAETRTGSLGSPDRFDDSYASEDISSWGIDEDEYWAGVCYGQEVSDESSSSEPVYFVRQANKRTLLEDDDGLLCGDCGNNWA